MQFCLRFLNYVHWATESSRFRRWYMDKCCQNQLYNPHYDVFAAFKYLHTLLSLCSLVSLRVTSVRLINLISSTYFLFSFTFPLFQLWFVGSSKETAHLYSSLGEPIAKPICGSVRAAPQMWLKWNIQGTDTGQGGCWKRSERRRAFILSKPFWTVP